MPIDKIEKQRFIVQGPLTFEIWWQKEKEREVGGKEQKKMNRKEVGKRKRVSEKVELKMREGKREHKRRNE